MPQVTEFINQKILCHTSSIILGIIEKVDCINIIEGLTPNQVFLFTELDSAFST